MKKNLFLITSLAYLATSSFAQDSDVRELPSFSKIDIQTVAKVYLRQEPVQSVKISSSDGFQRVETDVKNQTLCISGTQNAELHVGVPHLNKLILSGQGEFIGETPIQSDNLSLDISGDGKIDLDVDAKDLDIMISGLGKVILRGKAENADATISGSGKIEAGDLKTTNCKAKISGLGKCVVDVSDNLTADISGSGTVSYKNEPKNVIKNISGFGKISGSDETAGKADTTRLMFGKSQVLVISKRDSSHHRKSSTKPIWQGFEMGINSYVNSKGNFDLPQAYDFLELQEEKSISVGLNLFQKNYEFGHSNIWFFTGLGITWNNYRFSDNVTVHTTSPISATVDTTSNIHYIKSKLTVSYLMVPVMVEVFTNKDPKKTFHIGTGALLGMRIMSHTKQKYEIDGDTFKTKVFNDFGLNPFCLGMRAAVGFQKLNVYADYYFSSLFKSGKGPTLYPVNVGITFIGF